MSSQIIISSTLPSLSISPLDSLTLQSDKSIGINACREIKAFLASSPLRGPRKAVIIHPADRLTFAAQNSLLKILEEPPVYADLLLVTTRPESLLPTILSRCVMVHPSSIIHHPSSIIPSLLVSLSTPTNPSQALSAAARLKTDRAAMLTNLEQCLHTLSGQLLTTPTKTLAHQTNLMFNTYLAVAANANLTLSLSHLYLHWLRSA